ncbi:uncharacterized protein LOC131440527 [Malaya genurostris]|uniref:uncharacterized protein LOC131440527 n=1 Tax=Malaya genurostris TaxID=325434 RepID=UPI0026F3E8ED|nr:uncharacterized protein LOC131440527 [Malaya genurostris]XP_058467868.1 uncharacterized protein LOC131440527 [Malaya genurostris]XP_058467869.1 uncharacterized protein LOC131440527 [Malaya genurostris]XP_058467870.1 uncharacterized protein LOC131440527 [Malaya genurostris]
MRRIIVISILVNLLYGAIAAPVDRSQLLSSIQDIQRKYVTLENEETQSKEKSGNELENINDSKPEVDVDNIENMEAVAESIENESTKESLRKAKLLQSKSSEDQTTQGTKRKNKMFGYYGYYPQPAYPQPMVFPSYYPLEYFDDYSSLESYQNINPLANVQNYQQNFAALQNMAALQSLNNQPNLASTNLPNLGNLNNNQAAQDYQNFGGFPSAENLQNMDDEEILSRTNQAVRRRPNQKNSPIYYIRLPPTPYMFVPGIGYISQPPTIQPMAPTIPQYPQLAPPVTMSPFYNLPLNFVSNGKPSGIYQWSGAPSPAPMPQPAFALPYPGVRPLPHRPAFRPNPFVQDSKITHLKGPFIFNGRPEEIFLLQNSINPFFQTPINPISPYGGYY